MLKRVHGFPRVGAAVLFLAVALAACNEEKRTASTVDAGLPDASSNGPVLGGKLGEAVAAAEAAGPEEPADKPDGGPPETGIFTPAVADAKQPPNGPPKIDMFGEGNNPKLPLSYTFSTGTERKATVLLQVRAAQSQLTPLTIALVFKSEKPKDDKKTDKGKDKDKDKAKETDKPAEMSGLPVTMKIAEVKSLRGGTVGPDLENLKDVVVRYRLTPSGVVTDLAIEYPKKSSDGIELITSALLDAVMGMTMPLPDKPLGVGAFWMVTDRTRSSGVDVVRYRAAKVVKIEDQTATLAIDIRQYAANSGFALPGMPKEIQVSLEKYESQGKGEVSLGPDAFLPGKGQFNVVMQSQLSSPQQQQPGQRLMIQTDVRAALSPTP
jgi:hypothetical protein